MHFMFQLLGYKRVGKDETFEDFSVVHAYEPTVESDRRKFVSSVNISKLIPVCILLAITYLAAK